MIKKQMSLIMMVAIVFGAITTVNAQDDDKSYTCFESIMLSPDNANLKVLSDNMRKHNQTYHKEGTYQANVYNISSGPNAGKIVWMMGPMMLSDNDNRPGEGGHDEDWGSTVMPYIKKMHTIEYWRMNDKLSNLGMMDGDASKYPIIFVRYSEVEEDGGHNVNRMFKQISETVKAMEGENPWGLYYNMFRQGDLGRHIASVSFYKNWKELDGDRNYKETFLKVHGENSWDAFQKGLDDAFSNTWDEIWGYNAHMSGK